MGPDAQGAAPSWDPHCGVGPWGSAGLELLTSTPRGGPALPCGRSLLPRGQPFPCSAAARPPRPVKSKSLQTGALGLAFSQLGNASCWGLLSRTCQRWPGSTETGGL